MMDLYRFSLSYNDSYAFRQYPELTEYQRIHQEFIPDFSGKTYDEHRCKSCGELLNKWDEPLTNLVIKKKTYDIGVTYDGILVCSERFKSIYEDASLHGLAFRQLLSDPNFFMVNSTKNVLFDSKQRQTRFIKQCVTCKVFESVVGATPIYLQAGTKIEDREIVRTDLEFGSVDEKSPIFICGAGAADSLSKAGLNGLDLWPIEIDG